MERHFCDCSEVYNMIQYDESNKTEKPGNEGIIHKLYLLLKISFCYALQTFSVLLSLLLSDL